MKKFSTFGLLIISLSISAFCSACGNDRFSDEGNPLSNEEISNATSGLRLTVKNSLPEQQIGEERVRPHLNAYFCQPIPKGGDIPALEERCTPLKGVIRNGTTETFLVTKDQLAAVYRTTGGLGAFEFSDDHQITPIPWHCYIPNDSIKLDANWDSVQDWHVEVNQRYFASYGCIINKGRQ